MKIIFTRDIKGTRPRTRGEQADYPDAVAGQLIAAGYAAEAAETPAPETGETPDEPTRNDPQHDDE